MKKLLLALALFLMPVSASAQCNGIFPANTACGTVAGGPPGPVPFTSIPASAGGSSGQIQYNNAGALGGIAGSNFSGSALNLASAGTVSFGTNSILPGNTFFSISKNVATTIPSMSGFDPQAVIVGADNTRGELAIQSYGNGVGGSGESTVLLFGARGLMGGTAASHQTKLDDFVGELGFHNHDGVDFVHNGGCELIGVNTEDTTPSAAGIRLDVWCTPSGATSAKNIARFNDGGTGGFSILGLTSGTIKIAVPAVAGSNTLTLPAGTTDFSATGGTSRFVKQASTGAALTVVQPTFTDLATGTAVAFQLGGTVDGNNQQLNNIVIGNVSPRPGVFTNLFADSLTMSGVGSIAMGGKDITGGGTATFTTFVGALTGNASTATTATNATNSAITNDTATNATMFPVWVTANTGNLPAKVTSTKLSFNPSTGVLSSTSFTGAGTGLTGTAASFTAGNVTTNANLTGDITSVGNATTLTNAPVIAKVLTGLSASAGTLASTDSILQAFNKVAGLIDNAVWTTYTPTVTAAVGTCTSCPATGRYKQIGKTVFVETDVTVTTLGTASTQMIVTLPMNAAAFRYTGISFDYGATFKSGALFIAGATTPGSFQTSDATGATFFAPSAKVVSSVTYEVP